MTPADAQQLAALHRLHRRSHFMKLEASSSLHNAAVSSGGAAPLRRANAVVAALRDLNAYTTGKLSEEEAV